MGTLSLMFTSSHAHPCSCDAGVGAVDVDGAGNRMLAMGYAAALFATGGILNTEPLDLQRLAHTRSCALHALTCSSGGL
jgi:hypothetical protein